MKQKEKLALFDKVEKALKEGFYFFNEREGVINH